MITTDIQIGPGREQHQAHGVVATAMAMYAPVQLKAGVQDPFEFEASATPTSRGYLLAEEVKDYSTAEAVFEDTWRETGPEYRRARPLGSVVTAFRPEWVEVEGSARLATALNDAGIVKGQLVTLKSGKFDVKGNNDFSDGYVEQVLTPLVAANARRFRIVFHN